MKPLPVAPLSAEEIAANVWWLRKRHWKWANALAVVSITANVRDAELMLRLRKGACSLCLGEVAHTVECVGWRCDVWRDSAIRRRLGWA
jgi:hypothetical protein